jgi:hypothetical protein
MFLISEIGEVAGETGQGLAEQAGSIAFGNWQFLVAGIILIIIAIIILMQIKKVFVNSVLGLIAWAILVFGLNIELQLIPSLIVSAIFGLAGIGVILILKFLGVPI